MPRIIATDRGTRAMELADELDRIYGQEAFDVLALNMEIWFPWLGTDDDAGSGSDIIARINDIHAELLDLDEEVDDEC